MMINETVSKKEIGRTDELSFNSTDRSLKSNEIEDDIEEVDHGARIHEFFSKDSVIKFVLVVQFVVAVLSYGMLKYSFGIIIQSYPGTYLTLPPATKLFFLFFLPEYFLASFHAYIEAISISYAALYIIPHVAIFFIISMPFTGIYHLFRNRKKLFFYYFFATFPQEIVVLLASCFLALAIHPLFEIFGRLK